MRIIVLLSALLFSNVVLASSEEDVEFTSKLCGDEETFELVHTGIPKSLICENAKKIFDAAIEAKKAKESDFFKINIINMGGRNYELVVSGTFVSIALVISAFPKRR